MRKILIVGLLLASCSESRKDAVTKGGVEKSKVVSAGKAFTAQDYLVPDHVTILDFYADW